MMHSMYFIETRNVHIGAAHVETWWGVVDFQSLLQFCVVVAYLSDSGFNALSVERVLVNERQLRRSVELCLLPDPVERKSVLP